MIKPIAWDDDEAHAVRSLLNDDRHKKAMEFILFKACGIRDLSFRSDGEGGQRDTDFHEGRRFVGLQIMKMQSGEVTAALDKRRQAKEAQK